MTRSITVGVRLDPKLRYLAELAARKQRRSLSSFIEWAVQESLGRILLRDRTSVADEAARLWDIDEADRFVRLALRYPDLLTHEEQAIWKLVQDNGPLWWQHQDMDNELDENLILPWLREYWDDFIAVARGDADASVLPHFRDRS